MFYGTLLAPTYSFNLDGSFIGEIIGGGSSIQLLSNAAVNANVGSALSNTATVSESNESGSQSATATITINAAAPQLAGGSNSGAGVGLTELLDPPDGGKGGRGDLTALAQDTLPQRCGGKGGRSAIDRFSTGHSAPALAGGSSLNEGNHWAEPTLARLREYWVSMANDT